MSTAASERERGAHHAPREEVGGHRGERHDERVDRLHGRVGLRDPRRRARTRVRSAAGRRRRSRRPGRRGHEPLAAVREVLRELGVDQLVDQDERRDHRPRASHARSAGTRRGRCRRARPRRAPARSTALTTKLDLGEPARQLARPRASRARCPTVGRGRRATSPSTAIRRPAAAGRQLERRRVELGDALEVVLPPRELARRDAHRARARRDARRAARAPPRAPPPRASSTGDLEGDVVRAAPRTSRRRRRRAACRATARGSRVPEVSPIVGERRLTQTSHAAISAQSRSSSTRASRTTPPVSRPSRCSRRSRSKPGDTAPTSSSRASGWRRAARARTPRAAAGCACVALTLPKQPNSGSPSTAAGSIAGAGQAGCGITCTGPRTPPRARGRST